MKIGIYVHTPFCVAKCRYCSFISRPRDELLEDRYWRAVVREMDDFAVARPDPAYPVETLFFGGGTPSVLPWEHIDAIVGAARQDFSVLPSCEI
jgi:oxygen-independent coproporphyrinogen-3 oxidase